MHEGLAGMFRPIRNRKIAIVSAIVYRQLPSDRNDRETIADTIAADDLRLPQVRLKASAASVVHSLRPPLCLLCFSWR